MSFTQCSPTCGRMPLPALSLWPGRQPYRPRLVGGRRGGGSSSVAPRSRNPPTGRHRDSPISSSLYSHSPPLCAVALANRAHSRSVHVASAARFPYLQFYYHLHTNRRTLLINPLISFLFVYLCIRFADLVSHIFVIAHFTC